jgi:hypothetical protein
MTIAVSPFATADEVSIAVPVGFPSVPNVPVCAYNAVFKLPTGDPYLASKKNAFLALVVCGG